jgi:hypothetical protein
MKIHNDEKPFPCDTCGKACITKGNLTKHFWGIKLCSSNGCTPTKVDTTYNPLISVIWCKWGPSESAYIVCSQNQI